ncbi:hypothetical protein BVY03_04375 [bacterium K02(2017)]|nr:hypothetical protein BVY03_04375 [bacterium K02(2017)]
MILKHFICITTLILYISCGSTTTTNTGGGTTISNPPTVSSTNLSPDFDSSLLETSLTESSTSSSLHFLEYDEELELEENDYVTNEHPILYLSGPAANWSDLVLNGPFATARTLRTRFEAWALAVTELINAQTDFTLTSELQYFTLSQTSLSNHQDTWRVGISSRGTNLIRVVIKGSQKDRIWGYYLYQPNSSGTPIKGVYSFVNPLILSSDAKSGIRFINMAFDFSDADKTKHSFNFTRYNSTREHYVLNHLGYQCNTTSKNCVGELLRIVSAPPLREFSSNSLRLSWNDDSNEICASPIRYDQAIIIGQSQSFLGRSQPTDNTVTEGTCELQTPFWSARVFKTTDLPSRFGESNNGIGPNDQFGDGFSLTSWETNIDGDTVDSWLLGQF